MKIGIYGGSFNPPHLGHQNAAVEAAEKCALDKLLLIPAGIPPHKVMEQGSPANEHRLAMTDTDAQQLLRELQAEAVSVFEYDTAVSGILADELPYYFAEEQSAGQDRKSTRLNSSHAR